MIEDSRLNPKLLNEEILSESNNPGNNYVILKRTYNVLKYVNDVEVETKEECKVKRYKVEKELTKSVKERLNIPKFGACKGQIRGMVEQGIVRFDNDIKVADRRKNENNLDLKDKLAKKKKTLEDFEKSLESELKNTYNDVLNKNLVSQNKNIKRPRLLRDNEIKVFDLPFHVKEDDLYAKFSNVDTPEEIALMKKENQKENKNESNEIVTKKNIIRSIYMPQRNNVKLNTALITYFESLNAKKAKDKYNNYVWANCEITVRCSDDNPSES